MQITFILRLVILNMFLFTSILGCVLCSLSSLMHLLSVDIAIYMSMQVHVMLEKMI